MSSESIVNETTLTLISSDNVKFQISPIVASISKLLTNATNNSSNYDDDDGSDDEMEETHNVLEIPIIQFDSSVLGIIVDFMNFYQQNVMPEIEQPLPHREKFVEDLGHDFYREYTNKSITEILPICEAANFMQIEPLLNLTCASIGSIMKGKTPSQLATLFGIDEKEAQEKVADEGVDLPAPAKVARTSE